MNKKTLLKFLRETEALVVDENLYVAEKAFVINQIMNHIQEKKPKQEDIIKLLTLVNKYVRNELLLYFEKGKLTVELINEEEDKHDILASTITRDQTSVSSSGR